MSSFTLEAVVIYTDQNIANIVQRLDAVLQGYHYVDIDDFFRQGSIDFSLEDNAIDHPDETRTRLISEFSSMADEFNIHFGGVFFYGEWRHPFFLGKNAGIIQQLKTEYVRSETKKVLAGMGYREDEMVVKQMDYTVRKILDGKPLEAVLYQTTGLQTGLASAVPVRLLIVEDDMDADTGDATVLESPCDPGTEVAVSAFYSEGDDENSVQTQKYHEAFLAADPDSVWDRRELGADPRFVSTHE